jgi:hypothetical protein
MIGGLLKHKILILIIGIAIAGIAWYGLTSSAPAPLLVTDSPLSGPDQQLVETLLALRSVKLDGTIFSEIAFTTLQDYSTPIVQEPVGRPNPFAPLLGSATSSTRNTQTSPRQSR